MIQPRIRHYGTSWKSALYELYLSRKTASMFLKKPRFTFSYPSSCKGSTRNILTYEKKHLEFPQTAASGCVTTGQDKNTVGQHLWLCIQFPTSYWKVHVLRKCWSRTHLKHQPSLWFDTLIFFLPRTAAEHLCFFLQVQLELLLLMCTALP